MAAFQEQLLQDAGRINSSRDLVGAGSDAGPDRLSETRRRNDDGMATTDIIRTEMRREGGFLAWIMAPERRGPLLVAPAIVVLFVMNIFPLLWSFGLSFFNYRANRQAVPTFVGLANYERVLTDPVIWERFQTTAIIVGSSVLLQMIVGFLLALLFAKQFPLRRYPADPGADADDAVARRRRRVLQLLLRADLRPGQPVHQRLFTGEPFTLLATPRAPWPASFSPMPGCGRRSSCCWCWRAWSPCRNISTRRPRSTASPLAALQDDHLPLYPRPADAGAAVPHDRGLQAVRHRLHPHRGRPRHLDRDDRVYVYRIAFQYFRPASRRRSPTSCCSW